jgi:hypothetical protein
MLTQEILKHHYDYDPETGEFTSTGNVKYSNRPKGSVAGTLHKTKGYVYVSVKNKTYRAQRLAFLWMTGSWPLYQVDHINRNKSDNRWINLRDIPAKENTWNRPVYRTNRSGYTGVIWNKKLSKWQVLCRSNGIQEYLGLFDDIHEAGKVSKNWYNAKRKSINDQ